MIHFLDQKKYFLRNIIQKIEDEGKMRKFVNLLLVLMVVLLTPSFVFAQPFGGAVSFGGLMPLLLIFVFFYLFLIKPQQKKTKEHQKLLNALKKDDRVITAGGIYAIVSSVKGEIVEVNIVDGINIQVARQSIATVITNEVGKTVTNIPEIVKK
jgi:preprotein translocase subunit YajC